MNLGKFWEIGEGQGGLVCCSPWGCKESDMTWWLNNNNKGTGTLLKQRKTGGTFDGHTGLLIDKTQWNIKQMAISLHTTFVENWVSMGSWVLRWKGRVRSPAMSQCLGDRVPERVALSKYTYISDFTLEIIDIRVGLNLLSISAVQFSRSVKSDSLRPHEPQHARPPCPSPTPRVYPNSCPLMPGSSPSRIQGNPQDEWRRWEKTQWDKARGLSLKLIFEPPLYTLYNIF